MTLTVNNNKLGNGLCIINKKAFELYYADTDSCVYWIDDKFILNKYKRWIETRYARIKLHVLNLVEKIKNISLKRDKISNACLLHKQWIEQQCQYHVSIKEKRKLRDYVNYLTYCDKIRDYYEALIHLDSIKKQYPDIESMYPYLNTKQIYKQKRNIKEFFAIANQLDDCFILPSREYLMACYQGGRNEALNVMKKVDKYDKYYAHPVHYKDYKGDFIR